VQPWLSSRAGVPPRRTVRLLRQRDLELDPRQRLSVTAIDDGGIRIEASMYDPVGQRVKAQVVSMTEGGSRFYPLQVRYCWPSELDLMARLAGLELEHRWGGWSEEPFTAASGTHVSVYRKVV